MASPTSASARCPACRATLRPGAPWCTQCYAPIPAPGAAAATTSRPAGVPGTAPRTPASDAVPSAALWPCLACGERNALADARCASCGEGFLAALRQTEPPLLVLPVVGDLAALPPTRRLTVAVAVVLGFLVLTSLLGLLLA